MVDGRAWLVANCQHAENVTQAAWKSVGDFSLVWQLFEAKLCDNRARNHKLKEIAVHNAWRGFPQQLAAGFAYWKDRYISHGQTTWHFGDLFGGHDGREFVADALMAEAPDDAVKIEALLLIVLRLRNNLFHGGKEIETFNSQKDNLDHATEVLVTVLGWGKAENPQLF